MALSDQQKKKLNKIPAGPKRQAARQKMRKEAGLGRFSTSTGGGGRNSNTDTYSATDTTSQGSTAPVQQGPLGATQGSNAGRFDLSGIAKGAERQAARQALRQNLGLGRFAGTEGVGQGLDLGAFDQGDQRQYVRNILQQNAANYAATQAGGQPAPVVPPAQPPAQPVGNPGQQAGPDQQQQPAQPQQPMANPGQQVNAQPAQPVQQAAPVQQQPMAAPAQPMYQPYAPYGMPQQGMLDPAAYGGYLPLGAFLAGANPMTNPLMGGVGQGLAGQSPLLMQLLNMFGGV